MHLGRLDIYGMTSHSWENFSCEARRGTPITENPNDPTEPTHKLALQAKTLCVCCDREFARYPLQTLGYPGIWDCVPINWGTPIYSDALHSHILRYPSIWEMHSRMLGYPTLWECTPTCGGTPAYGNAFPYIGIYTPTYGNAFLYVYIYIHISISIYIYMCFYLGNTRIWGYAPMWGSTPCKQIYGGI